MTARTFRKKTPITAVQFTEDMLLDKKPLPSGVTVVAKSWHPERQTVHSYKAIVDTLEGELEVRVGYWIATGPKGEHWGIRPDIFEKTYEEVSA